MINIHKDDIEAVAFGEEEYINKRCSFTIDKYDIYKNIDLTDSFTDPKFSPFIIDILDKDKRAILTVLRNRIKKL